MPIARALPLVRSWHILPSAKRRSSGAWSKRFGNRLEFLCAVGLDYLSLDRSSATLSGRRSAADSFGDADRIEAARRAVCIG